MLFAPLFRITDVGQAAYFLWQWKDKMANKCYTVIICCCIMLNNCAVALE